MNSELLYLERITKQQNEEINKLNQQITILNSTVDNFKAENVNLLHYEAIVNNYKEKINLLEISKKEVDSELALLKHNSYQIEISLNKKLRDEKLESSRQINELKEEVSKLKQGYDNINRFQFYIETLEKLNSELREQVRKLDDKFQEDLTVEKEKLDMRVDEIRKNTLDTLAKSKLIVNENAFKNLSTSTKLQMIQITQLYGELNGQSQLLDELLIDRDKKERIINNLKIDLKIHEEVEASLTKQNQKLQKLLKEIDLSTTKEKIENELLEVESNKKLKYNDGNINNHNKALNQKVVNNKIKDALSSKVTFIHESKTKVQKLEVQLFEKFRSNTPLEVLRLPKDLYERLETSEANNNFKIKKDLYDYNKNLNYYLNNTLTFRDKSKIAKTAKYRQISYDKNERQSVVNTKLQNNTNSNINTNTNTQTDAFTTTNTLRNKIKDLKNTSGNKESVHTVTEVSSNIDKNNYPDDQIVKEIDEDKKKVISKYRWYLDYVENLLVRIKRDSDGNILDTLELDKMVFNKVEEFIKDIHKKIKTNLFVSNNNVVLKNFNPTFQLNSKFVESIKNPLSSKIFEFKDRTKPILVNQFTR